MKTAGPRLAGAMLASAFAFNAFACGFCIEDKIAAVYDHAVAMHAVAQRHQVAFFAVEGIIPSGEVSRRAIEAIAESLVGVDKGSARVSVDSASLSVAFDPARVPKEDLAIKLGRKLAGKGLTVGIMRIMDKPSELKVTGKR